LIGGQVNEPRPLAGRPDEVEPPAAVRRLIAGRAFRTVWRNELGGLTFEVSAGTRREFIKWAPPGSGIDFTDEIARLRWAGSWLRVPNVLASGTDDSGADGGGSWMVTSGLAGDNAVSDRWRAEPHTAVTAIGNGLRALHDALPISRCPFSWSVGDRIADVRRRAQGALIEPGRWHPEHRSLDLSGALRVIDQPPPIDRLVVCHGDACAPNTLLDDSGTWTGHVDLGRLGVADRWADLAVATWSTRWNYGPGWEDTLLAAYGVEPDRPRTAYYRLLWDL
jgi:aminoglycoside phosphotransferase